ncbi:uncharacterized protein LOC105314062 [Rhizophagus irregularis DAOM 181602=DAOM 197198]|nr:uncharacterized protein LOC105314062 [Rhizophagus irregularis DAOM 181602=DAOM 197198]
MKNNDEIMEVVGWRANVDLKPSLPHAALQYVSKYATVKAFLIRTVKERDFSVQETCHHLQLPLYHSSRNFVSLKLNKEANRQLRDSNENDENNGNRSLTSTKISAELGELSLFKLDQQYKLVKGNWVECSGENISSYTFVIETFLASQRITFFHGLIYQYDGKSTRSDWMTRIPENIPESERKTSSEFINVITT